MQGRLYVKYFKKKDEIEKKYAKWYWLHRVSVKKKRLRNELQMT